LETCVRPFRKGQPVAGKKKKTAAEPEGGSVPARLAQEIAAQHADLLAKLREEVGDGPAFAAAAERLAQEFGAVTATAVEAAANGAGATVPLAAPGGDGRRPDRLAADPGPVAPEPAEPQVQAEPAPPDGELHEHPSLYRPGQMRRRLEQLVETNRRHGHPFGLAVFDASGPGTRNGDAGGGRETVLAIIGAALSDSIRIVDEVFRLEEDAILVLAPNQRTVEGVQMAERLLGQLDELERAGGLRIAVAAGVVACPEHGTDPDELLRKADAALWRARSVGQPVGVGALNLVQDP
jgi:diguanylate cyclase (GGDEF)-like protein